MAKKRQQSFQLVTYKILDAYIFMCVEYVKTFIRECILLISQLVNTTANLLLYLFYQPGHYDTTVAHKPQFLRGGLTNSPPRRRSRTFSTVKRNDLLLERRQSAPDLKRGSSGDRSTRLKKSNSFTVPSDSFNQLLEETLLRDDDDENRETIAKSPVSQQTEQKDMENKQKIEMESEIEEEDTGTFDDDELSEDLISQRDENQSTSVFGMIMNSIMSVLMWFIMLIWYIPSLFKSPITKNHSAVGNDKVHLHEKKSTGLIQDIIVVLFEFTDSIAQTLRLLIRFQYSNCWSQLKYSFSLLRPSKFLSKDGIDDRSVEQIIIDEGYPYESIACETQDGYLLQMDRIPNKNARRVVYFQHGILDSSFAWVGVGLSHSLAFRAFSLKDVDVFLGNFRGYGFSPYHLKTTEAFRKKDYWDYSLNEVAFYDVRAFVEKIVEIKKKELNCSEDEFTITVVAHSMGAGSMLAYLAHSHLSSQKHHLSKMILLAPAGNHHKIPFMVNLMSYIALPVAKRVVKYFGMTSRPWKILLAKILQDINSHPALRSLWVVLLSKLLLGGRSDNSPFQLVHNLVYQSFNGTSVKLVDHFAQLIRSGKFQAFDYGSAVENKRRYSQPEPWDFLQYYKDISPMIPIHILYGDDDRIIPPENVLKHAKELHRCHGSKFVHVKKYQEYGHLELTLGGGTKMIKYILDQIQRI